MEDDLDHATKRHFEFRQHSALKAGLRPGNSRRVLQAEPEELQELPPQTRPERIFFGVDCLGFSGLSAPDKRRIRLGTVERERVTIRRSLDNHY